MNRFLIINNGSVVDVITVAGYFNATDYSGTFLQDYDTVVEDNGELFNVGDVFSVDAFTPQPTLEEIKVNAIDEVEQAAEDVRAYFTTKHPGLVGVYLTKETEAKDYIAAGRPVDASGYPLLLQEAMALNLSVSDLADTVVTIGIQWRELAGHIEAIRISSKHTINADTTEEDVILHKNAAIVNLQELQALVASGSPR